MKKLLAILLALMLVLVNVAALAAQPETPPITPGGTTPKTVTITKAYNVAADGAETPAHIVTFTVVGSISKITTEDVADPTNPLVGKPSADASQVTEAPVVTLGTAKDNKLTVAKGAEEIDLIINLPKYDNVGIYEYVITEEADDNNVAGVVYNSYTLRVTIVQGANGLEIGGLALRKDNEGDKTDTIENTFEAGQLTVTKTVTGNLGDKNKDFNFTVTFTAPDDKTVNSDIYVTENRKAAAAEETPAEETPAEGTPTEENPTGETPTEENPTGETPTEENPTEETPAATKTVAVAANVDANGAGWTGEKTYSFSLKDGESVVFTDIPNGVTWVVEEDSYAADGYSTSSTGAEDGITADRDDKTAAFINNKEITPDTGVELETLPYVVLMALAVMGLVALKARKREEY